MASASLSDRCAELRASCRIRPSATVGPWARRVASATASLARSSSSTTRAIRPQSQRLLGGNALAEHHHLDRPGAAGEARQQPGRAGVRDQADIDERLEEIGRAAGDDDVGGQRQRAAGAGAGPVHRGDDGNRQVEDRLDQRIEMLLQRHAGIVRQAAAAGEVGAARKAAALAGDQQAARARLAQALHRLRAARRPCAALSAFSESGRFSVIVATAAGLCSSRICSKVHAPPCHGCTRAATLFRGQSCFSARC